MEKYVCTVCGYVYDEAAGIPEAGIAPGTKWEDLPEDWTCPLCGAPKDAFEAQSASRAEAAKPIGLPQTHGDGMGGLSFGAMSALFANLAKGCEKQDLPEEAGLFGRLADYYRSKSGPAETGRLSDLAAPIRQDLSAGYPEANAAASVQADRGALRALAWSEKVTRILAALLNRYEKQNDALLENANVYVCEICGFVYIGNAPPEICPICKVPNLKIGQIKKEAV